MVMYICILNKLCYDMIMTFIRITKKLNLDQIIMASSADKVKLKVNKWEI